MGRSHGSRQELREDYEKVRAGLSGGRWPYMGESLGGGNSSSWVLPVSASSAALILEVLARAVLHTGRVWFLGTTNPPFNCCHP